ncbi:hypothetical protein N7465_011705 [Penicillium sp. CMV-2018d]|nr:hypothetical protein N7465_011705 [Penicillium sp. CMV-2018d]
MKSSDRALQWSTFPLDFQIEITLVANWVNRTNPVQFMSTNKIPAVFSFTISYHIRLINTFVTLNFPCFGCGFVQDSMVSKGNWRYILGPSLVFSTILFLGMLFLPESPRFLVHQGREIEAYGVWKKIPRFGDFEGKDEFLDMRQAVAAESEEQAQTK